MTTYRREAQNAEEIAKLLRSRGRIVITAPSKSGKTTELIDYAESRYPNGRFSVICPSEAHKEKLIYIHWLVSNHLTFVDVVVKRLLGEKLEGEDVNEPTILIPPLPPKFCPSPFTPIFVDDWNLLPTAARRAILKRKLFIAAVTSKGEFDAEEES
jgi:hypothetical protein